MNLEEHDLERRRLDEAVHHTAMQVRDTYAALKVVATARAWPQQAEPFIHLRSSSSHPLPPSPFPFRD